MRKNYLLYLLLGAFLINSPIYATTDTEPLVVKKADDNSYYVNSVSSSGWSYTCQDGIDVELLSLGIKNNVPASIAVPNSENVDRIVVELVYKSQNPGSTITIQDADGNSYTANREIPAGGSSYVWYYRTELPATASINYSNINKKAYAQSMLAYVFRNKNNGIGSSGVFTALGGYNNIETTTIPITTDSGPRTVSVELPISELTPDGRYIHIEVSAADGSFAELTETISSFPDGECCIKIFELNLTNVAGTVDEIIIKIDTRNKKNGQSVNGQSWVMGGAVKTDVHCSCVNDLTPPEPDAISLADLSDACSVAAPTAPTATDNCAGAITGTTTTTFPITTPGTTVVTWTFTDAEGNSSTQTQNVIINDVTAPVPDTTSLADLTDQCSVVAPSPPTATDNCDGTIIGTTPTTFPITTPGTTVVTWTFTDTAGNTITQTQNVVINDVTAPVATSTSLADLTDQCSVAAPTIPTATDNCDGTILGTTPTTFPITTPGTTVVTWTFTDVAGNSITQTQNVIVDDVTAPVANAGSLSDLIGECSVAAPTAPTATDNCEGTITGTTTTTFPVTTPGTTVVTWTFTDTSGNSSTQTQNVIINDVEAPIADAANLADLTGDCSVTAPTAPTATDNCGGIITGITTTNFPVTTPGTTVVTWTFTDASGNSSTQTQNVIIDDVTAPVADAASLANLTGDCSVASATAPTATDNCEGIIIGTTTTNFPVTTPGTTVVTWTFTDASGNSSTQTQNLIVDDVTAPVADAASLADLRGGCSVEAPAAPVATDNCDGMITGTTTTSFPVTTLGTTVITWTFTDASGNKSTQTQNVIVQDITPPTADNLEDNLLVFDFDNLPEVTFSDDCAVDTIEYSQYFVNQSCWADFGPQNSTTNVQFEQVPFDENHHWEYGYVQSMLGFAPKVHGRVVNNSNPANGWIVEIYFESLVTYNTWIASGGQTDSDALNTQREYANVDFSRPYSFKGFGAYSNSTITLLNTDPHYIEVGPKDEFGTYGAGFTLAYEGTIDGNTIGNGGSQNILMFTSLDRCIDLRGMLLVREWIVTDTAGNSQVFIQRLESEE
tara:strand:- start:41629 stop:44832 length:3204 start_codon:yes stop_codon:yes gene_type:complete